MSRTTSQTERPAASDAPQVQSKPAPAPLVLLVDDDAHILVMASRFLIQDGFRTVVADSGFGVTSLVRRHRPNAIVLDVAMPALDGPALARLLRESGPAAEVPIVFYSALDDDEVRVQTGDFKNATYVPKAAGVSALLARLRLLTGRTG